jgi:hypothetical protein
MAEAMERHGHLQLAPKVSSGLLAMSAATIDRALREKRGLPEGGRRKRNAPSAIRRSVTVRTFDGWDDPPPGYVEADLVAHSGPSAKGHFIQTLTVTDIASGWTECAPVLVREQTLVAEVLAEMRKMLPFELLGFDTDNDGVFLNETVRDYCQTAGIEFTRCRPYRKNDQACVEQRTARWCAAQWATGAIEEWDVTFRTNIYAMFYLTKAAVPHMREGSSIINTTSINADTPSPQLLAYATRYRISPQGWPSYWRKRTFA